jgi:hypothetical protein
VRYNETCYTAKQILDMIKKVKENPAGTWSVRAGWWGESQVWTSEEVRGWVRDCINNKINSKIKDFPAGRKTEGEFLRGVYHLRNLLKSRCRIRTPDVPRIYREKLAARIDDSEY